MQSKIYHRFRIVGALANAVFEAYDEDNDAPVTLYEWTPDADRRAECLERLEPAIETLHSEVFTVDASFYLAAATPAQGAEDLLALRKAGLFTGTWLNQSPIPPPPPPPEAKLHEPIVVDKPLPRDVQKKSGWSNGAVFGIILLAAMLSIGLGIALSMAHNESKRLAGQIDALRERADSAERSKQEEVAAAERSKQTEVAAANQKFLAAQQQMQPLQGVNLFRVLNNCEHTVRIATRSLASNGQWVVQGWWYVKPGSAATPVASPSSDFYYYAETSGKSLVWADDKERKTPAMYLSTSDFVYTEGNPSGHSGQTEVHPRFIRQANADQLTFTCKGQ